jgi:hypothetical protein
VAGADLGVQTGTDLGLITDSHAQARAAPPELVPFCTGCADRRRC